MSGSTVALPLIWAIAESIKNFICANAILLGWAGVTIARLQKLALGSRLLVPQILISQYDSYLF